MLVSRTMLRLLAASLSALLMGCPSDDNGTPDGPPGDGGTQGLTVHWQSTQTIPTTSDDPAVEEASLAVRSLRVIGDAASGDEATTRERVSLSWSRDGAPAALRFDQAPSGKYAKIDAVLRGWDGDGNDEDSGDAFEISGTVRVGSTTYRYEIEDSSQLAISLPLPDGTMLSPGGALSLTVRVNWRDVVKDLNFSSIPPREGTIRINDDTPAVLSAAREALVLAMAARRDDGGKGEDDDHAR